MMSHLFNSWLPDRHSVKGERKGVDFSALLVIGLVPPNNIGMVHQLAKITTILHCC